ncbi:MAG: HAD family phosphatase [Oscillospiraceae bacterium]|nr:HAD family phosphatase [Oscillospiraceae bacterium]
MKIKGVIFDMDGVLLNSEVLYQRFWLEALHYYGYPAKKEHILALRSLTGKNAELKLKSFFGDSLDYERVKNKRIVLMDEYVRKNGVEIKKGADEILPYLKEKGIKIALATSSPYERAQEHLGMAGLFKYFDQCVCGGMVKNSKPQPDIYILASEKLGLKPCECIAVEDSPNGVKSAVNAGCKTVMIPDLTPCTEDLKKDLFALCTDLTEIKDLV